MGWFELNGSRERKRKWVKDISQAELQLGYSLLSTVSFSCFRLEPFSLSLISPNSSYYPIVSGYLKDLCADFFSISCPPAALFCKPFEYLKFKPHYKRDWLNCGAKLELSQHKARISPALSWKSWENRVFTSIKQAFSQHKAGKILF